MGRLLTAILLLFFTSSSLLAQFDSASFFLKATAHKGFIIPHSSELQPASEGAYPLLAEVDISWLDYSKKGWGSANCYRKSGMVVGYTDFGNENVLGEGSYFLLYTEPQLTFHKVSYSFTAGVGLIHLNTVYDRLENSSNLFYSNPWSGLMRVAFNASYQVTQQLSVAAHANFNHISNGRTRIPNYGMNFPTASFSLAYRFRPTTFPPRVRIKTFDARLQYAVDIFTVGRLVNAAYPEFGKKRMKGLHVSVSKHFNHCSSWVLGTEISYDESLPVTGDFFGYESSEWISSLMGGHSLSLGKVSFAQLLGVYLYKKYDNPRAVFQRYVLNYALTKNVRVGFSLKAHAEVAEMLDWRLGITF